MTILEVRQVKATRKPWRCDGCRRSFSTGTPKERQRIVGDDGPYAWQSCPTCQAISNDLFASDIDYSYEGVSSDNIQEYVEQAFGGDWAKADAHFQVIPTEETGK